MKPTCSATSVSAWDMFCLCLRQVCSSLRVELDLSELQHWQNLQCLLWQDGSLSPPRCELRKRSVFWKTASSESNWFPTEKTQESKKARCTPTFRFRLLCADGAKSCPNKAAEPLRARAGGLQRLAWLFSTNAHLLNVVDQRKTTMFPEGLCDATIWIASYCALEHPTSAQPNDCCLIQD